MGKIYAIGLNTFREAVRSKVLYAILFFSGLLILLSMVFGELSLYQQERVIKDLGVVIITLFSALIAIYTGVSLLHKEIDKKTIYTIVSKPVERWQFLTGKYLGMVITILVEMSIMTALFLGLLLVRGIPITLTLMQAILLIFLQISLLAATALLFSAFSSPFLSGMMTALFFLLGNLYPSIDRLAENHDNPALRAILQGARLVLPDLSLYNISTEVTYDIAVSWSFVGFGLLHACAYVLLLLIAGSVILHRRDFI